MQQLQIGLEDRYSEITQIISEKCKEVFSDTFIEESKVLCKELIVNESVNITKGKADAWACGVVHALAFSSGLFNKELKATDVYSSFNVSKSTALSRSKEIRDVLNTRNEVLEEIALTNLSQDDNTLVNNIEAELEINRIKLDTTISEANKLVNQVKLEKNFNKKVKIAKEALMKNELCTEAYLILSYDEKLSPSEKLNLAMKAKETIENVIGIENIKKYFEKFKDTSITTSMVNAKARIANLLWNQNSHDEAIQEVIEILEISGRDELSIRGKLAIWLLEEERYVELDSLLARFKGDYLTSIKYSSALYLFSKGDLKEADRALRIAFLGNKNVIDFITRKKRIPKILPESKGIGTIEDAINYISDSENCWQKTKGAIDWIKSFKKSGL